MCFCWFCQFIGKSNEVKKIEGVRVRCDIGKMLLMLHINIILSKKISAVIYLRRKQKHSLIQVAMLSGAIPLPIQMSNKLYHLKFSEK